MSTMVFTFKKTDIKSQLQEHLTMY